MKKMISNNTNFINNLFNYKLYRFTINSFFFFLNSSFPCWTFEINQISFFKKPNIFVFIKDNFNWIFLKIYFKKFFNHFTIYVSYFKFKWFRFVLFSGLGYKRRFFSKLKIILSYIADRHWILYKFDEFSTVIPTKKRNFIFFSSAKGWFSQDYGFFSDLRNPYVYKTKGFLDRRVRRRFLFARRIKLRSVKTKLSKKQQLL